MKLSIKGLSGALENNVEARLSVMDESRIANTPYFRRYLESEIQKALRALGYYAPTFTYQVIDSSNTLVVMVDAGRPVLIEAININLSGEGQKDNDFITLLGNTPKIGSVLHHGEYDSFKNSLKSLALRKGFFDADMTRNQLAVADTIHQGFWFIDFDTGQRYRFGEITFDKSQISESYLRNIIPFEAGDEYLADDLSLFSRRLSSTGWFNSVSVIPLFSDVDQEKSLPLRVITSPRRKNSMGVGLGFSTDNGLRGRLTWTKPWINDRGHSFQSSLLLSSPESEITASYKIPLLESPLEYYYTIQGGYKKVDNNDTDSESYTFGVIRNWDMFEGWQRSIGLNVMYDSFTQADDDYNTFLFYPSVSFSRVRSEGRLFTLWGDSQRYSLEAAAEDLASDINFIRFQIQQTWIRTYFDYHRFVVRGHFGLIQASNFDRVPPSFRFFAGGDRSIRGYSYQSISPKDSSGKLKGGSRLMTGSIEYQYNLTGDWWSALFIDSGQVIDKLDKRDFHTGAGFGIRWVSPVGAVKLDLASPVGRHSRSVHLYIGLGTEL